MSSTQQRERVTESQPRGQAEEHAERMARKADERRKQAEGGLTGAIAGRAGKWSLDDIDPKFIERQKYLWNPVMDWYFRMEIGGWDNIPEPPCLLIGVHSGAPFVWDAWTVGVQWFRHFGPDRLIHGPAHDILMPPPAVASYFRKRGALPAAPASVAAALAAERDVIIGPGGEIASLRWWPRRDEADLGGRI